MMEEKDRVRIVVGIVAGIVFIIGFGIGIELYLSTSENDKEERINLQSLP